MLQLSLLVKCHHHGFVSWTSNDVVTFSQHIQVYNLATSTKTDMWFMALKSVLDKAVTITAWLQSCDVYRVIKLVTVITAIYLVGSISCYYTAQCIWERCHTCLSRNIVFDWSTSQELSLWLVNRTGTQLLIGLQNRNSAFDWSTKELLDGPFSWW